MLLRAGCREYISGQEYLSVVFTRHNISLQKKKNMSAEKWTRAIDEITAAFKASFGHLPPKRLNWKPNGQTWSIAQNIDHLIVINSSYYPVLEQVRAKQYQLPWLAKFDFVVNLMGKTILKAVDPERRRKMKTFSIWEPANTDLGEDILERFEQHQEELKKLICQSMDLVSARTVIASPASRKIVYRLDTAFDIIVTHERRHLEQAKELLNLRPAGISA